MIELASLKGEGGAAEHFKTGISEFDRPLGGGAVPGSGILIGGDPGIGKSTLLLQALGNMAKAGQKALYVTGEESVGQIRMRAKRLGVADADLAIAAETSVANILATLKSEKP
ncbi:MAG TPA: ATPase domain-containing protein, partial [Sphingomonadales bacterium]|nr:ATPase domain-containing protein [Sphingomonadales bacterium]